MRLVAPRRLGMLDSYVPNILIFRQYYTKIELDNLQQVVKISIKGFDYSEFWRYSNFIGGN